MKNLKTRALALTIAVVSATSAKADMWIPFDNFAAFRVDQFVFNNEKGIMDVSYETSRASTSGGIARLQAGRYQGDDAYGVWSRTWGNVAPPGSYTHAHARCGDNASKQYAWSGFWTLYDQVNNLGLSWHYFENDIMETWPSGSFFNRYIAKNVGAGVVVSPGQSFGNSGKVWWRNNFREYRCTLRRGSSTFSVSGDSTTRTINTPERGFWSRLMLSARPWGPDITNVPQNSRIADLEINYIWLNTP